MDSQQSYNYALIWSGLIMLDCQGKFLQKSPNRLYETLLLLCMAINVAMADVF